MFSLSNFTFDFLFIQCEDDGTTVPSVRYNFIPISHLYEHQKDQLIGMFTRELLSFDYDRYYWRGERISRIANDYIQDDQPAGLYFCLRLEKGEFRLRNEIFY